MHLCNVKTHKLRWSKANGQVDNFLAYFKTNFVTQSSVGLKSGHPSQYNGIGSSHKNDTMHKVYERTQPGSLKNGHKDTQLSENCIQFQYKTY